MKRAHHIVTTLALALAACSPAPDLSGTIDAATRNAPYPDLQNIDAILSAGDAPTRITPASVSNDAQRLAALNAKANRLRNAVLTQSERARLRRGVAVPSAIR